MSKPTYKGFGQAGVVKMTGGMSLERGNKKHLCSVRLRKERDLTAILHLCGIPKLKLE